MKAKITLQIAFCFSLLVLSSNLLAQSWLWGQAGYGSIKTNDYASPVATDKNGNAYITGQYSTTIIFGNDTLNGVSNTAYLTKYSAAGSVIWARQLIESTGKSFGYGVATDRTGNIYITGYFAGNAQAGTFSLNSSIASSSVFLVKYNANGTVLWAKQSVVSPTSYGFGRSVATDKVGNIFITGYFQDTISFWSFTLSTIHKSLNTFLVEYDSNGNVLWAKQSEAPSNSSFGYGLSVATDNSGNSYITGYFQDTLSFGATSLINTEYSGFLVKYSSSGNVLWARQSIDEGLSSCINYSVITDEANNAYITGYFQDTVEFGSHTLYSPFGSQSIFFTKYDTNGIVIWAKQSSEGWVGTSLASDANNHIYMAGGSPSLDALKFGNYSLIPNPTARSASFLMKFDTSGNPICGSILNNLGFGSFNGMASDLTGTYIYTASTFEDTVFCGPDTLLDKGGGDNTFLGRWQSCEKGAGINPIAPNGNVLVYPNPNNGVFTLSCRSGRSEESLPLIKIYNLLGEQVLTETLRSAQGDNLIDISNQPNGVYLCRVISNSGELIGEGKVIIQK